MCSTLSITVLGMALAATAPQPAPGFKPELVGVELTARAVRPGDPLAVTVKFRNAGTRPAEADYRVFLHFEAPPGACRQIVIHADHDLEEPTTQWQPGQLVVDGPRRFEIPADMAEQELVVHVGLYDHAGKGGRLLDRTAGTVRISPQAPPLEQAAPRPLPPAELEKRRQALAARIPADRRASLQTPAGTFTVDRASGVWQLTDAVTGVAWTSDPARPAFGQLTLRNAARSAAWRINRFDEVHEQPGRLTFVARPTIDGQPTGLAVTFAVEPVAQPAGLRVSYQSQATGPWQLDAVRLLDHAFTVTEADEGRFYVPFRLGIERAASQAIPANERWTTYNNLTMTMCGAVKQGAALLVNWDEVGTRLGLHSDWPDLELVAGRRAASISLDVQAERGSCTLHPLGRGDYVTIARAYRALAEAKGWRRTWGEKRSEFPTTDRIFGATDFKPFVLSRVVPGSRFCTDGKERVHLGYTFDQAAELAEHWRNDLGIDRAYVVLAGWINGGYDVRHPDPLPAAPECGGNEGLARAAARIKALGYLFGLHDNYQDMYQDAPSYDLKWINKDAQGRPKKGGNWNGGQAWQVCAIEQVALASRPQTNLPRIAGLFGPTIYFIDTVFAWGLVTCEDPAHPMTRRDDLAWKSRLCLLAKKHFGLFGSEEGREWAVPCADYLEGLFGHQTDSAPGAVIPLFPLVYSDCVQIMTHQGDRIHPGDEKKVADHVLFAEMPVAGFGGPRYWDAPRRQATKIVPLAPTVKDLGSRRFAITYRFQVEETPAAPGALFVHFTQPGGKREGIVFQHDHAPRVPLPRWSPGVVEDGPYTLSLPEDFRGQADVRLGLTRDGQRLQLGRAPHEGLRYLVGRIKAVGDAIEYHPETPRMPLELWTRGDDGWPAALGPTDRVIKNTWEVLSPLNVITAERPLDGHEFLTPDRLLQRTRFGDLTITVAYEQPAAVGDNRVPAYGFIIESPAFVAFCATRYNGIDYPEPALFTARSLDGRALAESARVRVYHGFGRPHVRLAGKAFEVPREAVVSVK